MIRSHGNLKVPFVYSRRELLSLARLINFTADRRFIFGGHACESIAAGTNTRSNDSHVAKLVYRIISGTGSSTGRERRTAYSMGDSRFTRGSQHPIGSIMPCGAYLFVYLRAPLCTDGADNIDVAIIL